MHSKTIKEALEELNTVENGLSESEAESRLRQYGFNEIKEAKKISPWQIFLNQFKSFVVWILIFAVILSAFLAYTDKNGNSEEYVDALVIFIIIILIAVLGFVQEYKAERAIEALKKLSSLKATVSREGKRREIDSKLLVPGDIIFLETGNKIPADSRLIEAYNLQIQESALTGESQPVKKLTDALPEKTILADRKNMAFSGTIVVSGRAKAIVALTGMQTEIGKIATLIEEVKQDQTPLQKNMDALGKRLGQVTIVIAVLIFAIGFLLHKSSFVEMLKSSVAVAVAAVPEGLPLVVTISLALGTQRMLKRNALVRRLPSVETLGSTTVICTDKTGTLTMDQMTVKKIFANNKVIEVTGSGYETKGDFIFKNKKIDSSEIEMLLKIGALNNNSDLKGGTTSGDPTEIALIVTAAKAGMKKDSLMIEYPREDEIEFTSERKMMTTIHRHHGEKISFVKGAPEVILKLCNYINVGGKIRKLTEEDKQEIHEIVMQFGNDALRVLGFAYKTMTDASAEKNLIFAGLQGMMDPPREEVKDAIEKCKKAGIKVVMITGDHEITAKAVAKRIGLEGKSMAGQQLEEIEDLNGIVEEISVFARVNPEHKIKIVDALKKKGHIVAMTGDGVNDAPALKKADIGIAMGKIGTDVSKEASSMILIDDNFASIVNAVEEGRGTYDNIKKYFGFLLSGNIAEVMVIFLGMTFGLPLPLTATHLLLINLVTDGLPAFALSADPFEPNAMSRKPRKQNEPIYRGLRAFLVYYPIILIVIALTVFNWFYDKSDPSTLMKAQTAAFIAISMSELYQAFASRSTIYPSFKVGYFRNRWLVLAVLTSVTIITAGVFIPSFGNYIDMVPLALHEFLIIAIISSAGAVVIEISKWMKKEEI